MLLSHSTSDLLGSPFSRRTPSSCRKLESRRPIFPVCVFMMFYLLDIVIRYSWPDSTWFWPKVFLRGRGKIRGGAKKWVLIRTLLVENGLHNMLNSLFLRGGERNRGGA